VRLKLMIAVSAFTTGKYYDKVTNLMTGIAMKSINPLHLAFILLLFAESLIFQPALAAATPAGQDKLRIHTSIPKKASDSLFSYTVEWRVDNGDLYRATGISILNAAKLDGQAATLFVTKKLLTAFKDGLMHLEPIWRGVTIAQPDDQPLLALANKAGYSMSSVTIRDYTNQTLSYDLAEQSFKSAGVEVALDLVLAADVEFIEGFTTKKAETASQGDIEITLDGQKPVLIKTDGKTTRELEEEIVKHLTASRLSQTPLVPSFLSNYDKNNKPFDGSEVLLPSLNVKTIRIDITDPNLGILTKFKFKDDNYEVKVIDPMIMLPALGLTSILTVAYFLYRNSRRKRKPL